MGPGGGYSATGGTASTGDQFNRGGNVTPTVSFGGYNQASKNYGLYALLAVGGFLFAKSQKWI
ncbi:MAG: hypothetical protein V6Z81_10825 [Parvularculales bacterium]